MVSALFQSRPSERGGTRKFTIGHCSFGWSVIEDLYTRELERIKLKHTTGGHLSAANYATAKATLLTKSQAKGKMGTGQLSCIYDNQN